jgi:ActR/RegA family two-component response regulator
MRILLVEDDSFKMNAVISALEKITIKYELTTVVSLREAMTAVDNQVFDFVILDMAIPSHNSDGGTIDTYSQPVGGLDVLLYLSTNIRSERVAILTQYPTVEYDRQHVPLKKLVKILHGADIHNIVAAILFDEREQWKIELITVILDE